MSKGFLYILSVILHTLPRGTFLPGDKPWTVFSRLLLEIPPRSKERFIWAGGEQMRWARTDGHVRTNTTARARWRRPRAVINLFFRFSFLLRDVRNRKVQESFYFRHGISYFLFTVARDSILSCWIDLDNYLEDINPVVGYCPHRQTEEKHFVMVTCYLFGKIPRRASSTLEEAHSHIPTSLLLAGRFQVDISSFRSARTMLLRCISLYTAEVARRRGVSSIFLVSVSLLLAG